MINPISLTRQLGKAPYTLTLSREEERVLLVRARNGDERAANLLFFGNARYIVSAASTHTRYALAFGLDLDDLISETVLRFPGMIQGASTGPNSCFPAYVYASTRMFLKQFIRESGSTIAVPRSRKRTHPETLRAAENARNCLSWDCLLPHMEKPIETPSGEGADPKVARRVRKALTLLSPRQRDVAASFYGFKGGVESKATIARRLGIKVCSIRYHKREAINSLRNMLKDSIPFRKVAA